MTSLTLSSNGYGLQNIVTVQENGVDLLQMTAAGLREEEVYAQGKQSEFVSFVQSMI